MRERAGLNILLVIVAAVPLAAAVGDFVLARGNSALRADVSRRQHQIVQATQLMHVNQALVREIAVVAVRTHDGKLRDLLTANGIAIGPAPEPTSSPGGGGAGAVGGNRD